MRPLISIVIPTYNEALTIEKCLDQFNYFVSDSETIPFEVIVSDYLGDHIHSWGAHARDTKAVVSSYQLRASFPLLLVHSVAVGRAFQMNEGAKRGSGEIFLFLHADTVLPKNAFSEIKKARDAHEMWGGFYVTFYPRHFWLNLIAYRSNLRIRFFKTVFGDQALFVERGLFKSVQGFPSVTFMEDIAMSRLLRQKAPMAVITTPVVTSSRRFLERGIFRTYFKMFLVRLLYQVGVRPEILKRYYENH